MIGGTSAIPSAWTPGFDLAVGEIYTWSVQALNGSVPVPAWYHRPLELATPTLLMLETMYIRLQSKKVQMFHRWVISQYGTPISMKVT